MYAPQLYETERSRETVQEFLGYNHNLRIGEGEFYNMKNLTGKHYPVLSPRAKRSRVPNEMYNTGDGAVMGMIAKDKLAFVSYGRLFYGGNEYYLGDEYPNEQERQLVSMGAYIIVFPDMYYLNTATGENGSCYTEGGDARLASSYQMFGEDGSPLSARDMIWSENCRFQSNVYIDPTATERYKIYGVPKNMSNVTQGEYSISYVTNVTYQGYAEYEGGRLFYVDYSQEDDDGVFFVPNDPTGYETEKAEHIGKITELCNRGSEPIFGEITITATVKRGGAKQTYTRTCKIRAKLNESGKFVRSSIDIGDRKMYFDGAEVKSQLCTATQDTPEKTYIDPACWRDEATVVRVKVGSDFVTKLREVFNNGESHTLAIAEAQVDTYPLATESLLAKYGASKYVIAKDVTRIVSNDTIDIQGFLDFFATTEATSGSVDVSVSPKPHKFDYVIESNNRLWACRYGTNYKGDFVNEIYATARGSFRAWDVYKGTSDDSYTVSLGSDGAFTGAINYKGVPMFFKENTCHAIYGSYPSAYQLVTDSGTWVASGSHKSIVNISNALYFHGRDGVYRYDGASLDMISNALGSEIYSHAVAGECERRYYISMKDQTGAYTLFVYDTAKGIWHKEDSTKIVHCATYNGDLYFSCGDYSNGFDPIYTVNGTDGEKEQDVEWEAETGRIGFVYPNHQYIGKLQLRMILPVNSTINLFIEYDSDGYWDFVGGVEGKNASSFSVPIMPRRCDHFRIKLAGRGDCKIFSLTKTLEQGGEE